jgi:hypothetical protein
MRITRDLPDGWDTGVAEFSPDGSRLAIAVNAQTIIVIETAQPDRTLHHVSAGNSDHVLADLAISGDNRYLAVGTTKGEIVVHDLVGKGMPTRLPGSSRFISRMVASGPVPRRLFNGSPQSHLC